MLTCKQVSRALANGNYRDLPAFKRFFLQMHVMLCFICRRENRNIMVFQDIMRGLRQKEESLLLEITLPEAARRRIRNAMQL